MSSKLSAALPKPPTDTLQIHILGTEALLFCQMTGQLYYLNTSATYIWCALLEGMEPSSVATALASQFGIPPGQAHRDVSEALSTWTTGLPAPSNDARVKIRKLTGNRLSTATSTLPSDALTSEPHVTTASCYLYSLDNLVFQIRYATECVAARVHPVFAHLEAYYPAAAKATPIPIDILSKEKHYQVRHNGRVEADGLAVEELAPCINRILLSIAFESSNCLAAFHAGAVSNSQASVLLPGAPGSGKSTLVAALVKAGFHYLTDELALLMSDQTLRPLPISSGLKRGAWPLFSTPLTHQPVHRQADGTEVIYIPITSPLRACPPLRAIVFPRYSQGAEAQLTPLSPAKALYELSTAGYAVSEKLDHNVVSRLVAWIAPLPCYQLQVDELDSAVASIRNILT